MSRYRKVDPRIWNDEKFRELSDCAKLMFFMLLTHPSMTALGAMRATLPGLAAEIGWTPEGFREAFREASQKGMAEHDERACLVALPRFLKYNPPESPNVVKAWAGSVDLLPECRLKTFVLQRAQGFAEGMSEGFRDAFRQAFPRGMPNQEQEQEQEQKVQSLSSSASPSDPPADLEAKRKERAERLAQITVEAITAYNAIIAKPVGLLSAVGLKVGREKRRDQVAKCLRVARQICEENYGSTVITPEFWRDYFTECARDDFLSGVGPYSGPHANWRPDFEFLTRETTVLKVYDRAASEDVA